MTAEFDDINDDPQNIESNFDPEQFNEIDGIKSLLENNLLNNNDKKETYLGICLWVKAVEEPPPESRWERLFRNKHKKRYIMRVRVPGVHNHLPDPYNHTMDIKIICLYPIFVADDEIITSDAPNVGDIVEVSFKGKNNNDKGIFIRKTDFVGVSDSEQSTPLTPTSRLTEATPNTRQILTAIGGGLSSGFGGRINPKTRQSQHHKGTDISLPPGTPLYAPFDGYVNSVNNDQSISQGFSIEIYSGAKRQQSTRATRRSAGPFWKLFHLQGILDHIHEGYKFKKGEKIAESGNTGSSTGPHLHLEYWPTPGGAVDPLTQNETFDNFFKGA